LAIVIMVMVVMVVMVGWVGVGWMDVGSGTEEEEVLDAEEGRFVGAEEGGGFSVVVGTGAGEPPGTVGIAVGASVLGICPAGTKTVVVTKTVVTALGAAYLVEKTVSVSVPSTTLCRKTVTTAWAVRVEVTVCSCLFPTSLSGARSSWVS